MGRIPLWVGTFRAQGERLRPITTDEGQVHRRRFEVHASDPELQLADLVLQLDAIRVLFRLLPELVESSLKGFHPDVKLAKASKYTYYITIDGRVPLIGVAAFSYPA